MKINFVDFNGLVFDMTFESARWAQWEFRQLPFVERTHGVKFEGGSSILMPPHTGKSRIQAFDGINLIEESQVYYQNKKGSIQSILIDDTLFPDKKYSIAFMPWIDPQAGLNRRNFYALQFQFEAAVLSKAPRVFMNTRNSIIQFNVKDDCIGLVTNAVCFERVSNDEYNCLNPVGGELSHA